MSALEKSDGRCATCIACPGFAALAWHEVTAVADANLDRLVHNAYRIERKGKTPPSEK